MGSAMYYLVYLLLTLISIYEAILVVRAICSWVPYFQESRVYEFAFKLTEPVLYPIRSFLFRFEFFKRFPIDFSMLILFLLLGGFSRLILLLVF